ncbi:hypothetical protein ACQEVZ_08175 [Dactylosporangium sp. CA-152071]
MSGYGTRSGHAIGTHSSPPAVSRQGHHRSRHSASTVAAVGISGVYGSGP